MFHARFTLMSHTLRYYAALLHDAPLPPILLFTPDAAIDIIIMFTPTMMP